MVDRTPDRRGASSSMSPLLARVVRRLDPVAIVPWVILAILVVLYASLQQSIPTLDQIGVLTLGALVLILVAFGQTLVILTGGIDLSVGGVVSLGSAIAATRFGDGGASVFLWIIVILAMGVVSGAANGVFVTFLGLQPFIVTLATWSIMGGVALVVLPTQGGSVPESLAAFVYETVLGLPVSICLLFVPVAAWLWLKRTRLARAFYAVGSDEESAVLSGVSVHRVKIVAYCISGLTAAAASIVYSMQTASGDPLAGNAFILNSVAAVIIGGTSLSGGRGGVGGSIAGAYILIIIADVVFAVGLESFWTRFFQGLLLIAAVLLSSMVTLVRARGEDY